MSRWFVGSSSSSRSGLPGERAAKRGPRQLAAGEGVEPTVQHRVVAEPEPVERRQRAIAPGVAARVLERRLGVGVAGSGSARRSRRRPFAARPPTARARAPAARERRRACSHGASRCGRAEGAGRAVTPSSPSPARAHRRRSTPRRRASAAASSSGTVATGQRHPVAALELERDATQQRLAGDVLAQIGGDDHGHRLG